MVTRHGTFSSAANACLFVQLFLFYSKGSVFDCFFMRVFIFFFVIINAISKKVIWIIKLVTICSSSTWIKERMLLMLFILELIMFDWFDFNINLFLDAKRINHIRISLHHYSTHRSWLKKGGIFFCDYLLVLFPTNCYCVTRLITKDYAYHACQIHFFSLLFSLFNLLSLKKKVKKSRSLTINFEWIQMNWMVFLRHSQ